MSASSTCRSVPGRSLVLAALAAILCTVVPAHAIDPERALSQYIRDRWSSENGYPGGPVYGITQSADGYLWIAAEKGVVRFDGLTFRLFEPSALTAETGPTALGVVPAPDGSLWARLRGPALVRYHHEAFENILSQFGQPEAVVTAMLKGRDNVVFLAMLGRGAISYAGGTLTTVAPASSIPTSSFIISIAQADNGDVWPGTRDSGLLQVRGRDVRRISAGLPDPKVICLLAGDHGEVWIGTDKGVVRWDGSRVTAEGIPDPVQTLPALAMMRDRESNVWLAAGTRGLFRINSRGVTTIGATDGLTGASRRERAGGTVTSFFEDRDGNVWLGTTRGVERLRDGAFTTYTVDEHLPTDGVGPIYVDPHGRTWFAPPAGGLYWLQDGAVREVVEAGLGDDVIYSIAGGNGDLWLGRQRGGDRLRVQGGSTSALHLTQADGGAEQRFAATCARRGGLGRR